MALKVRSSYFDITTNVDTTQIFPTSKLLTKITGSMVQANKAIVGANAFAHESGIHQAGVIKDALTYEIMKPESIGLSLNQLVLGKHSGRAALKKRINTLGYDVTKEELKQIFDDFKRLADKKKVVYDEDLEILLMQIRSSGEEKYQLLSVNVTSGTETIPTATIVMKIDGEEKPARACLGDGPVDAALNTIREIVGIPCVLTAFVVKAITGGTDAQGVVSITIEWEGIKATGRGSHTDIVIASGFAFVNALNRLVLLKKSHSQLDDMDELSGV